MISNVFDNLFQPKEHFLTIRYRDGRYAKKRKVFNSTQILRAIKHQEEGTDLYITKYASDMAVYTIILDFDSADKSEAYKDVITLQKYLQTKKIKSVIVESGQKGYHIYIQIKPIGFSSADDPNELFTIFVEHLIYNNHFKFKTLDESNSRAGLKGNIRVIGSTHPVTGEKCRIINGKFLNFNDDELYDNYIDQMGHYQDICYEKTLQDYRMLQEEKKQSKKDGIEYSMSDYMDGFDPLKLDLREVVKDLFSPSVVRYSGGKMWCTCFAHDDSNPSMVVSEDMFYCKSCGAKGNAWTLIKEYGWKPFKNGDGDGFEIGKGVI